MLAADTSRAGTIIRAAQADDAPLVGAFVASTLASSPYVDGATAALGSAFDRPSDEARALVAMHDGRPAGVVVYGGIAGSLGAGRLQLIVVDPAVRRQGLGSALMQSALTALVRDGMRVAFVELPGDPALSAARSFLLRCGFHVDASVADYYRDGVDLLILRHELPSL